MRKNSHQILGIEMFSLYEKAIMHSDFRLAYEILKTMEEKRMYIPSAAEPQTGKPAHKHPTPFDEDPSLTKIKALAAAIEDDAPKQEEVIKENLGNPFNEEPDEKVVVTTERFSRKNHVWTEQDKAAIMACMNKPDGHSHRKLKYIKSRLSPNITDVAFQAQLRRMGFRVKRGRALWKKN